MLRLQWKASISIHNHNFHLLEDHRSIAIIMISINNLLIHVILMFKTSLILHLAIHNFPLQMHLCNALQDIRRSMHLSNMCRELLLRLEALLIVLAPSILARVLGRLRQS